MGAGEIMEVTRQIEHDSNCNYLFHRHRANMGGFTVCNPRIMRIIWLRFLQDDTDLPEPNGYWFVTKARRAEPTNDNAARQVAMFFCRGPGRN